MFGSTERNAENAGRVWVTPEGKGGVAGDITEVPRWLSHVMREKRVTRKVAKLVASGFDERHLYLHVDDSGAPFAGYYAMAFTDDVPVDAPVVELLTDVWIAPRWSRTVLRWNRDAGWSRHEPYDDPRRQDVDGGTAQS